MTGPYRYPNSGSHVRNQCLSTTPKPKLPSAKPKTLLRNTSQTSKPTKVILPNRPMTSVLQSRG